MLSGVNAAWRPGHSRSRRAGPAWLLVACISRIPGADTILQSEIWFIGQAIDLELGLPSRKHGAHPPRFPSEPKTEVPVRNTCLALTGQILSAAVDIALASHVHAMDTALKVK